MHLLTQSALLQALGWTLVNSFWQMGLLWLSYWLLTGLFHRSPSHFRHGLALTLLAFGALGSIITFIATYFFDEGEQGVLAIGWGAGNRLIPTILPWCSSLYLLVLGALLIRYSHQYLHSRRLTREGLSRIPAEFRVFVASTSRLMGIRPEVKAWLSTLVDVPMTLGFWKPVILLPAAMITNLSTAQVEAILVHELAHIRRSDYLINLGVTVVGLIFFFNPFSRLLIRQLQKEREHCCDDEVLQFRYDAHAYVSALLSLARQHRQGRLALAATGGGDDQLLLQRARKILQQKRTIRRPGPRPFILLFLTAAITLFSLSSPPREQPAVAPMQGAAPAPLIGEMVFTPIVNTGAPTVARPGPGVVHTLKLPKPVKKEEEQDRDDVPAPGSVASADVQPQTGVFTQPAALTVTIEPIPRDNSLGKPESPTADEEAADDLPPMGNLVFVPNSSFSFKPVDTLRPEDKLTWIEEATEKEIRTQVARLEKELQAQLELLRRQEARARTLVTVDRQQLKKLLNQQIQVQHDYLRKLDEMHSRIKKTGRRLTTVYI
jgi:beta-lactamase regulating signal transducer with metallopeptidase domain